MSTTGEWVVFALIFIAGAVLCIRTITFANDQLGLLQFAAKGGKLSYHHQLHVPKNRFTLAVATNRFGVVVALITAPVWVTAGCIGLLAAFLFYIIPVELIDGVKELAWTIKSARR